MDTINAAINTLPTAVASVGDTEIVSVSKDAVLGIVSQCFNTLSQKLAESTQRISDLTTALTDNINRCTSMEKAMKGIEDLSSRLQKDAAATLEQAHKNIYDLTQKLSTSEQALAAAKEQLTALPARILKLGEHGLLIGGIGAGLVVVGSLGHRCAHEKSKTKKAFFSLMSFAGFAAMCFVLFNKPLSTAAQTLSKWTFTK